MDSKDESTENLGALHGSSLDSFDDCPPELIESLRKRVLPSWSDIPTDFIAFNIMCGAPRRYERKDVDNWDVWRWSDRWEFFDNVGDDTANEAYTEASMVFVRHNRRKR